MCDYLFFKLQDRTRFSLFDTAPKRRTREGRHPVVIRFEKEAFSIDYGVK